MGEWETTPLHNRGKMTVFTAYVDSYMGALSSDMAWDATKLGFIVAEALDLYGVDSESEATDNTKAHALLKVAAWQQYVIDTTGDFSYSADGESYQRNQAHENGMKMLSLVMREALQYLPDAEIEIGNFDLGLNPYARSQKE